MRAITTDVSACERKNLTRWDTLLLSAIAYFYSRPHKEILRRDDERDDVLMSRQFYQKPILWPVKDR